MHRGPQPPPETGPGWLAWLALLGFALIILGWLAYAMGWVK